MADDEVIDLAGSDDEAALKEEDHISLQHFGLPVTQQPESESDYAAYVSAPKPYTDADAAYAELLQRRELDVAERREEALRSATAPHLASSSLSGPTVLTAAVQSALISEHRHHLSSSSPFVDVFALFGLYSTLFFRDALPAVSVRWSSRMTLCAGLCRYDVRAGSCEIALSESLLRYRSKQEVVETLLHEMIHAYLFVGDPTQRDHEAHGANFCGHMRRVNELLGLNISVYHTFHAEVRQFKRHVWQCQGRCKDWKPYFGKVSRAMNRKPGAYDSWWKQHQANCGGYFVKVQGPTDEELKAERRDRERKKRAHKRRDREREEKREEIKEDERRGLRQTDLRDAITATPKKRKTATKKKDDQQSGRQQDDDGEAEAAEGTETKGGGQAKAEGKMRKRRKKFPGPGHVLGGGEEVPVRSKRKTTDGNTSHKDDSVSATAASVEDTPSASQPAVGVRRIPVSPAAAPRPTSSPPPTASPVQSPSTSLPRVPVTPAPSASPRAPSTTTSASSSSASACLPLSAVSASALSSASGSAALPAAGAVPSGVRRRTTNVFDLMAARGEGSKVHQLVSKAKQQTS